MEQSFIAYIKNSIQQNWDLDALTRLYQEQHPAELGPGRADRL